MGCQKNNEADDLQDWEEPDESDQDDDSNDLDTEPCPWCKKPIHEQSEWCPYCGKYISREDQPLGKRFWWTLGVVAMVILAGLIWNFG